MNYVTDTHSLVWYFTADSRLSKRALKSFEGTTKDPINSINPMNSMNPMVAVGFAETIARIEAMDNFEIASFDMDVLRMASSIEADLEMHDKLIVATALCYDAALITRDDQITKSKTVKTVW